MVRKLFLWLFLNIFNVSIFYYFNYKLVEKGLLVKENRPLIFGHDFIGLFWSFFAVCLISPVLEELGFRTFLSKNNKMFLLGVSFFIAICMVKIASVFFPITYLSGVIIKIGIGVLVFFIFTKFNLKSIFKNRDFYLYSIVSSLCFSVFHIGLNFSSNNFWYSLFSVFPFFISGMIYCRVRIDHGLIYSIVLHSLYNSIIILLNIEYTSG